MKLATVILRNTLVALVCVRTKKARYVPLQLLHEEHRVQSGVGSCFTTIHLLEVHVQLVPIESQNP